MKNKKIAGLLLIIFGTLYLTLQVLASMGIVIFNFWDFWPLIIIALGLIFEALYYSNQRNYGFLIPGGIFTTIGFLHLFETLTHWQFAAYTWPIYILAIFNGFAHIYLVTKKQWALIVSIIFFCITLFLALIPTGMLIGKIGFDILFSALIIIVGIVLLFGSRFKKK